MWKRRLLAAWGIWLAVGGVIAVTVCHAVYRQSDAYRREIQSDLQQFFGLPMEVGDVAAHGFTSRQLKDVRVWLPGRTDMVFRCPLIVWDTAGVPNTEETSIDIHQATWMLGSQAWGSGDYTRVLQAGLRHDFQAIRVGLVRFHQARLEWLWPGCRLYVEGVDGKLVFDAHGQGQADLVCHNFNGYTTSAPIHISARVDPEAEDLLPEVVLVVPELPLNSLGLNEILQSQVTQGAFSGTITLRQAREGDRLSFTGKAAGLRLDEWTQRVPGGAISGTLNLTIEEAVVQGRQLRDIRFRGDADGIAVDRLFSRFGWPEFGGTARLRVFEAHLAADAVRKLNIAGQWNGGSLDSLCSKLLGRTGIEGRLGARINSLILENDQIVSGDVELSAEPSNGRAGTIQRALLLEAFEKVFGLSLPSSLLPEQVEYVQMGVRMLIDRREVRILCGQGPAGPAVITTRLLGQNLPLGAQLDVRIPIDEIRAKVEEPLDDLKRDLRKRLGAPDALLPASRPAAATGPE